jgi:hypothetical protein
VAISACGAGWLPSLSAAKPSHARAVLTDILILMPWWFYLLSNWWWKNLVTEVKFTS